MKNKTKPVQKGFTIIEVLIVVAAMGLLLLFAVTFVGGDTAKANFTTSINNFRQQLESIVSETANGYYPNQNTFSCNGATTPVSISSPNGNGEGQNFGCIFLGKIIQFAPNGDTTQFSVMPVVGNQFVGTQTPLTISQANPIIPILNTQPQGAVNQFFTYGLKIYSMTAYDTTTPTPGQHSTTAVAFLAGDSGGNIASASSSSGSGLNNGAEPLSLYYDAASGAGSISSGAGGISASQLATDVSATAGGNGLSYNVSKITVCVTDGARSGLFQFGGTGSISVQLAVKNDGTC